MATNHPKGPSERTRRARLVLGLSLTLLCSIVAFALAEVQQRRDHARVVERRAHDIASSLRTGLATPVEALHAVQAFMETPRVGLSHEQFQAFCRPALARQTAIVALEWFPLVQSAEREAFERWVRREQAGFQIREPTRAGDMVSAVSRDVHVPLTYSEPLTPVVHGLDVAFDPPRIGPVWRALDTGRVTLSDRYQLVEDPVGVFSVVAYAPVKQAHWVGDPLAAGSRFEQGVAVALFRLNRLIESALDAEDLAGVGFELVDPNAPMELRHLYRSSGPFGSIATEAEVPFVDKTYRLTVYASAPGIHGLSWGALVAALLIGGSSSLYFAARTRALELQRAVDRLGVYQLEGKIASGGMGTVFKARHALLKRPTAIKIAREGSASSHFEKEVLLTSALTHPNTVLVYDFGRGEDGAFYYAMEFIDGYDLEQLVRLTGALPAARVVRILLQVAGSLEEAHRLGLVHRDVKPSNVMLTERGGVKDFVKVLDFGLAKSHAVASVLPQSSALASVAFAGTPGYVAPEVIAGGQATPAADVFSFGCLAYFLLAGRTPFGSDSATEALTQVLTSDPPPLPAGVPSALELLVRACLSKKPEERPASMRAIADKLKLALTQCNPWTQDDAERWWAAHPKTPATEPAEGPLTFYLRQRRTRSSTSSQSAS